MRKPQFQTGLQMLFTPEALVPFIIGGVALGLIGNALYQVLANRLGTTTGAAIQIGLGALLVLMGAAWVLSLLVHRLRPLPPLIGKKQPEKRKGLILLVSNEPICEKAIEWHADTLERCWLFCSTQSAAIAERLCQSLKSAGKEARVLLINDVYDPVEYRREVEAIFGGLPEGWAETDVVLDFTGMTSCASVGSVLACLSDHRAIQYTPAQYDARLKATQPLPPVEVVLHWNAAPVPPTGPEALP